LIEIWKDYDPNATGWITIKDLIFVMCELLPPLGMTRPESSLIDDQETISDDKVGAAGKTV